MVQWTPHQCKRQSTGRRDTYSALSIKLVEQVPAHYQRGPPPPALQCLLTQSPIICIHDTWAWSYISTWHLAKRHLLLSKTPTSCLGHLLMMSILNTSRITPGRCSKVLRMISHVGLTHHQAQSPSHKSSAVARFKTTRMHSDYCFLNAHRSTRVFRETQIRSV